MGTEFVAVAFTILFTIATSALLGRYMSSVFTGSARSSIRCSCRSSGSCCGSRASIRTSSRTGSSTRSSLLISNVVMWLATWTIVTLQQDCCRSIPDGIANMEPTLAFNTISSFTTNTNLQHYSGETGLSYFSQMFVITFLQFVTAATGVAARVAVIRGLGGQPPEDAGQLLRRSDPRDRSRVPAARDRGLGDPDVAGHADDVRGRREGDDARGAGADHRARRHRRRRVDQAARHQRRRLFRAELRAPVREPDAALELRRDLVDHHHPDGDGV